MSAILHPSGTASPATSPHIPNIFLTLFHSLWGTFCGFLGMVGLRPMYLAFALVALIVSLTVFGVYGQMTGRVKFTLEPEYHKLQKDE